MTPKKFLVAILLLVTFFHRAALAGDTNVVYSTPPASSADLEAAYAKSLEIRTDSILTLLALTDAAKSNAVHDILIAQYRALRARDEVINAKLKSAGKEVDYLNRSEELAGAKILHDEFLAQLSAQLTPEQIETVKDKMTYNKVKVTYDAYCAIIPNLIDADKEKIMELLKAAREEAIDGGSAPEKSAIFQKYKNQINDYLDAHGHDVAQAYKDWNAKHPDQANTNAVPAAR